MATAKTDSRSALNHKTSLFLTNMAQSKLLNRCSLILAPSGGQMFLQSRAAIAFRSFLRIWFVAAVLAAVHSAWRAWNDGGTSIRLLNHISYIHGMTVSHALLFWKRRQLEQFFMKLADGIDVKDCHHLIRWIYILLLLYLTQVTYFVASRTRSLISGDVQTAFDIIRKIIYASSIGPAHWIVSSSIFYWIVLQMMFMFQKGKLEHLKRYVSLRKLDYQVAYTAICSIMKVAVEFEDLISLLPFLWFMGGIVSSSAIVYRIVQNPSDISALLYTMADYAPPIVVVIAAARVTQTICRLTEDIMCAVNSNSHHGEGMKLLLLRELDSLKTLKLTGMSYFTLDRSFLLSYIGSILTFAVLIAGFKRE